MEETTLEEMEETTLETYEPDLVLFLGFAASMAVGAISALAVAKRQDIKTKLQDRKEAKKQKRIKKLKEELKTLETLEE